MRRPTWRLTISALIYVQKHELLLSLLQQNKRLIHKAMSLPTPFYGRPQSLLGKKATQNIKKMPLFSLSLSYDLPWKISLRKRNAKISCNGKVRLHHISS
ncbi:hypothetical protein KP509_31G041700 [Ceratopteris richardii]|uniref:Uncharacterized protein n=1 Tax=Ceratopteris richardii TaxID=49495 RepID=A0A8T2QZE6_CERRI|nr:hypothetical protein KP509_31G041700 [Ceratopteris richardii]